MQCNDATIVPTLHLLPTLRTNVTRAKFAPLWSLSLVLPTRLTSSRALHSTNMLVSDVRISSVSVREPVRLLMLEDGEAPKAPIWRVCREAKIPETWEKARARKKDEVKGVDVSDSFSRAGGIAWSECSISLRIGVKDTSRRDRARQRDMTRETLVSDISVCLSFKDRRPANGMRPPLASMPWCKITANVRSV